MTTVLEIRLFGGLEISQAGAPLNAFMSNKAPALLAYLALHPRPHQRDVLATLLWGELGDADAKNNLRQVLTNLRKVVDPYLLVTRETIGFNPDAPYFLDVAAFEQHLATAQTQPPTQQMATLQAAAALYRGDFLAGFFVREAPDFEEWLLAQKARWREVALHALHTLTALQMSYGHFGAAIASAGQALALDPWREEAHRQLMLALARSGQRSAALAQYRTCRQVLQQELGVEPSLETQALFTRLRAAGASIPHNLPPQPTAFVGRMAELEALEMLLLNRDCRLLTLVGVGGVGKTRLALQAAERLLQIGAFLNGVYHVPLAGLDTPDLLATALAEACGLTFTGNQPPSTQLSNFLRNQEVLFILDTFEHLLSGSGWLGELLQRAPAVKLLFAARERLQSKWEWLYEVNGLEETSAMTLFTLRAQMLAADFAPMEAAEETQRAIRRICGLVQGLPLGIELAAGSVRHYPCAAIADAIAHNLDPLSSSLRDTSPHHRSIRAVFDYSWQLLTPMERQLFPLLAVFPASFSQAAALAVCQTLAAPPLRPAAVSALLTGFVDKSLLQRSTAGRFQLHPLLRQYSAEQLASQPAQEAATYQGHTSFYRDLLGGLTAAIGGSRQPRLLTTLEEELENVRAAWQWAMTHEPATHLLPMIDSLFEFYEVRSLVQEAGERFGQALQAVQQRATPLAADKLTLLKLLNRQGRFLFRLGRQAEAEAFFSQAQPLAAACDQPRELALAANYLGLVKQMAGLYEDAICLYQESLTLARHADDRVGMARALNNLGVITFRMGTFTEAEGLLQQALTLRRQLGDPKSIADTLNNLGILLHAREAYEQETQLLQEALATYRQLADRKGMGSALHNLGGVQLALGRYEEAQRFLDEALDYRQNDPVGMGNTLNNLGTVAFRRGDAQAASVYYQRALQVAWENKDIPITLDILVGIAECLLSVQKPTRALSLLAFVQGQSHDSDTLTETARLLALARAATPTTATQDEAHGATWTIEQAVAVALQSGM